MLSKKTALAAALIGGLASPALAGDFGTLVQSLLHASARPLFGFRTPVEREANAGDTLPRATAAAAQRQFLARGLTARFVTRSLATSGDMIAFWPDAQEYTHLIVCIEQGRSGVTPGGAGGLNAGVQRVNVVTGQVETILHGTSGCDGIRTTPWGTVLATEEEDDGNAYEILDPIGTTGHWVADRATGDIRDAIDSPTPSATIVARDALPTIAWEGIAVLPSGVVIAGDELRPGTATLDADGGAIFKFVPSAPAAPGVQISDLAQSPLVAGDVFALTLSCQARTSSSFPQYGQGCEIGEGAWVRVDAAHARADADARGATGYYRPEDLHADPAFAGPGARFCWTNTGNEAAKNYSEVLCAVDEKPSPAAPGLWTDPRTGYQYLSDGGAARANLGIVVANRFVEGDARLNSADNLDFQPRTRNVYVIEDHAYGEVFACLPDGADRDLKTDGCVSMLSIRDDSGEPTGFIFDASGKRAFYVVQHGEDAPSLRDLSSNPIDGRTDDLIMISGFEVR